MPIAVRSPRDQLFFPPFFARFVVGAGFAATFPVVFAGAVFAALADFAGAAAIVATCAAGAHPAGCLVPREDHFIPFATQALRQLA